MLDALDGSGPTEVDVLIESQVGPHPIRIALECRDHKRKQDRQWVQQMIGKYAHLPVQKVIAVSRSGFTKKAYACAAHSPTVELLTFRDVHQRDWPAEVARWKMAIVTWHTRLIGARVTYVQSPPPNISGEALLACAVADQTGHAVSTIEQDMVNLLKRNAERSVRDFGGQHLPEIMAKQPGEEVEIEVPYTAHDRFLVAPDGSRHQIQEIVLLFRTHYELQDQPFAYAQYQNRYVGSGEIDAGSTSYSVALLLGQGGVPQSLNIRREGSHG
jgi:hypothetical protein